ncbi:MAG: type II toxin-antitoxin system RelE/ParE family toxin [Bacteroidales bacterium]|nr:type II toxin-antitoxin system RelE/ParE family toxin [Bacteroidales bacterium]
MKVRITKAFSKRIEEQVEFIAKDKPLSARKFKSDIMKAVRDVPKFPYSNRKSIFFD